MRMLIVAICSFLVSTSYAYTASGHANVLIQAALGLQEQSQVSFGNISLNDGICDLGVNGLSEASSCRGEAQLGEIVVTGDSGQSVSIVVGEGEGSGGVAFEPSLQSSITPVLVEGETVVKVGGRLTTQDAQVGAHVLTYTVTVNYN